MLRPDPGGWVVVGMAMLCLQSADDAMKSMVERSPSALVTLLLAMRGV